MLEQKIFESLQGTQDLASRLIVEELYRLDITEYAVAPGARMLPLLNAIHQHPKTNIRLFNDERQLAFWAKSYAKEKKQPVVLLVTSGTALGNLLPGVMEAFYDQAPLLIITCDRPWELQNAKANQTVKQENFFAEFSKQSMNLPALEPDFPSGALLSNIDQLISTAKSLPNGPVHLNLAFRKPYYQENFNFLDLDSDNQELLKTWAFRKRPFRSFISSQPVPDLGALDLLINDLNLSQKTLIIAGPQDVNNASALNKLAVKLNAPILADINSNLRGYSQALSLYNLYLPKLNNQFNPDLILYFGDRIISEKLRAFLAKQDCPKYLFTETNYRQDAVENEFINFDYHFFTNLSEYLKALEYKLPQGKSLAYLNEWKIKESESIETLDQLLTGKFSEASFVYNFAKIIPNNSLLFHSSSLIFRELEYFGDFQNKQIQAKSNRGCVGIDGVISSALGAYQANNKRTYLLIGDQAANHDLTALALLPKENFHILLINNAGGAVFNLLGESKIQPLLLNNQAFNYQKITEAFDLDYCRVENLSDLEQRLSELTERAGSSLTEIITDGVEASEFFKKC